MKNLRIPPKLFSRLAKLLIASLACTLWVTLDSARLYRAVETENLILSRQIISQIEGHLLDLKLKNANTPVSQAIRLFTQSSEPHFFRIEAVEAIEPESSILDLKNQRFTYSKILNTTSNDGVKITIDLPFMGFLGTRSRFFNDLAVLLAFLIFYLPFHFYGRPRKNTSLVLEKILQIRTLLLESGKHVREIVRGAHEITISTSKTQKNLGSIKSKVHENLYSLRQLSRSTQTLKAMLDIIENEAPTNFPSALKGELLKLKTQLLKLSEFEKEMEPLATDLDQAVESFQEAYGHSDLMMKHSRLSMQALLEESKIIEEINSNKNKTA